ncbi:hypothetical protein H4696_005807 [Amycolatopsis lexingtonensis]|uniref:DUF998 domain-containing protein n=1 Tax=Amycolatopsis lexingtonensis TaxID=218822 RepID=A0ABR9I6A6_9PSEU|nr:hypothetical protein [Amycolatopsis lexingtonensis]MBE1498707.1 hypothetical protein [Amycolatopsis lexingtonensis]
MNNPPNNETLRTYIAKTYYSLRWGMAGIAFLLPFFLLFVGPLADTGPQPDSISGYYHTPLRDVFVGALVTTGTFMVLYKIFTPLENWLLNIAGVSTILVAMLPCAVPEGRPPADFTFPAGHAVFAIITFVGIGLTAIFCAKKTLTLLPEDKQKIFRVTYRTIGWLMIGLPVLVGLFDWAGWVNLFWVEAAGLWVFSAYWIVKTIEFGITGAEKKAITGTPEPVA